MTIGPNPPPHPCANNWQLVDAANRLRDLLVLVDQEDQRQCSNGCDVGGWAYWLSEQDFYAFRTAYLDLLRALNAPSLPPGDWGWSMPTPPPLPPPPPPSPYGLLPIPDHVSNAIGVASLRVQQVLQVDEDDDGGSPGQWIHPAHGLHGWLGGGQINPLGLQDAESLLTGMRNALDR